MSLAARLRPISLWAGILLVLALVEPQPSVRAESFDAPARALRALSVQVEGEPGSPEQAAERLASAQLVVFQSVEGAYIQVAQGETDEQGLWQAEVPVGSHWLLVRHPEFARATRALLVEEGEDELQELVRLVAGRTLQVEVRGENEAGESVGLSGATVLVDGSPGLPWGASTDEQGRAELTGLPRGAQRVQIFARGYEPYVATVESDLVVQLRPVMQLLVKVMREGTPEPNAQVHLSGISLWPARTLTTNAEGQVLVSGLAAGWYSLYAATDTHVSEGMLGVELAAERNVREVVLHLQPGLFVEVRVENEEAEPIPTAQLTWSLDGLGQFAQRGETDEQGRLRMGPFLRKEGLLQVSAPGYVERLISLATTEDLVVVLLRTGTLSGRVVDERGFPIAGAELEVMGTDVTGMPVFVRAQGEQVQQSHFQWALETERTWIPAGELGVLLGPVPPIPLTQSVSGSPTGARFVSDDKGRVSISGVPPGQIVVRARHPEFVDGKSAPVQLSPGGTASFEVVLRRGQALRGRVLDDRGFPASDARVELQAKGYERLIQVEPDGTFVAPAIPERVTLRISRRDRPLRILLEKQLLNHPPQEELVLHLPAPRAESRFVVRDARGQRIQLAQLRLLSLEKQFPLEETRFTNEEGEVEWPDTRGLSVRVQVRASGYAERTLTLTLQEENAIELLQALTVEGRVTQVRGRLPAEGAQVQIVSAHGTKTTQTNELGEYRLTGLSPGAAQVRASHPEWGRGEVQLQLVEAGRGRATQIPPIDLVPGVEVSGRVVDAGGRPLSGVWVVEGLASPYFPRGHRWEGAVQTDAHGEFLLVIDGQRTKQLSALWPARAGGTVTIPNVTGARLEALRISLEQEDEAPADETGSVLVGLWGAQGQVYVASVFEPRPADPLVLQVGDRLVAIDGAPPRDREEARALLSGTAGTSVSVQVERRGQLLELRAPRENFAR